MNDPISIMNRVSRFAYIWDFQGPNVNFVLSPHNSDRLSSGDLRYLVSRLSELEATVASQKAENERMREALAIAATWTAEPGVTIAEIRAALQPKEGEK